MICHWPMQVNQNIENNLYVSPSIAESAGNYEDTQIHIKADKS